VAVLDAIAGYDAADLLTEQCVGKIPAKPYTSYVNPEGLKGARVGVLRELFQSGPAHAEGLALTAKALDDMKKAGAILVDPVNTGLDLVGVQKEAGEYKYARAFAINAYLARLPASAPIHNLDEMIAKGGALVKPAIIESAKDQATPLERTPGFVATKKQQAMLRAALIDLMDKYQLDVLVCPFRTGVAANFSDKPVTPSPGGDGSGANNLHSFTGLPSIIVPGGFFSSDGMPFGIQMLARPFDEATLIKVGSGYEAVGKNRKAPASTPALQGEHIEYRPAANNT
jgi:Asp-tRNA(Asn)/Glu-tRNA(Gln) amidotransferase A subunit family amidase